MQLVISKAPSPVFVSWYLHKKELTIILIKISVKFSIARCLSNAVVIWVFFLPLLLNKKWKWKHKIPTHLHTIPKPALLKPRESHFFVVWVMELKIIPLCLVKVKDFLMFLACQSLSTFNVCMKTVNEAKWLNVCLWTKWSRNQFPLQLLKFKISRLFQATRSLIFRQYRG